MPLDRYSDPRRFALGIGLPDADSNADHAGTHRFLRGVRKQARKALFSVVDIGTRADLAALFQRALAADVGVVTLLAHNTGSGLQLQHEVLPFAEVEACVPEDYEGYLDLLVCHSNALGDVLRWSHPRTVLFVNRKKVPLKFCLAVYAGALREVIDRGTGYMEAVTKIRTRLLRRRAMNQVDRALDKYETRADQEELAASDLATRDAERTTRAMKELRKDLAQVRRSSTILFALSVAAAATLGITSAFASAELPRLGSLLGEGIGIAGILRAWRTKLDTDTMLALLKAATSDEERRKLISAFRRRGRPAGPPRPDA